MTLAARLDAIRTGFAAQVPPETKAVMDSAAEKLRAAGFDDRVLAVGAAAPDFTLPDSTGSSVARADLLTGTGLVLVFFRGHW